MKKSLKQILTEMGHRPPVEQSLDIAEWQEPRKPQKRWLTLGDLVGKTGTLVDLLVYALQNVIAIVIWSLIALCLLAALFGGCHG